jgi:polysaccharide export outer membrane protein
MMGLWSVRARTDRSIGARHLLWALAVVMFSVGVAAAQSAGNDYRIGPKDVLKVTVWGHDDLSRSVSVSTDGTVIFPLVGEVRAAGLTASQLEERLRALLGRDYLVDPQVSVAVQEYRSQRVFVFGEVVRPGIYMLSGQSTLLDILSQAGGPSATAGREVVVVRLPRSEGPAVPGAAGSETFRVSLRKLLAGGPTENLAIQDGDSVYVPKATAFFVLGEVLRQGSYVIDKDTSALEAITLAGGFTDRAAPAGARILRKMPDGSQQTIDVNLSGSDPRAREILLAEGDTLIVPKGNAFFVSGEVRKPGAYQLESSTTAFTALTLAGGFTEKAAQSAAKLIRRLPSGGEEIVVLDLSGSDRRAQEFPLKDGDTLVVPAGSTYYVLGEVRRPGPFQMDPTGRSTSVTAAISQAGGLTEKAAQNQVRLTRRLPSGEEQATTIDLSDPSAKAKEIFLKDGDILLVPLTNVQFYIMGEVRKPGAYQLDQGTTIVQGIALAGGFTEKAAPNRTRVIRTHPNGRQETLTIDLNDIIKRGQREKDLALTANDVVVVPESFF